ncbi:MAG TPA: carboxypeptidase regulatory-like domain-containing protein, partial [Vicinamibacteria bacterium]|nr:carboxypeptidase regulatory-like domain-containing protein [Vicinamibacteria bacterium]
MKRSLLVLAVLLAMGLPVHAQLATGNIYGTVTDESGAPLPGAAVLVKGAAGNVATTASGDGRFRVLNLAPGSYKITATLAGFSTVNRENVVVTTGTNVEIPFALKVASVEETITVTAETPVIDTKRTGTSTVFTQDELSKIPNSRDPWALLRTVPGVVMDRVNIAGNESGQQSGYRAKGANGNDGVWSMDGVNVTDMAAIGASPSYFDYDAF